jgi:uncharacterized protein YndB with AHSA1/START domain
VARVEVSTHIEADVERVWALLVDWESQPRWMVDARSVEVRTERRDGAGTVIWCETDLAGLVVSDRMEVTEFRPPAVLAVRHTGWIIRGIAAFELEPTEDGTLLVWWEEIDPPLGALGEAVTATLIMPRVRKLFRASLANLKRLAESTSVRP